MTVEERKREARVAALLRRQAAHDRAPADVAGRLWGHLKVLQSGAKGIPVSGYVGVRGELDALALLERFHEQGCLCGLPVMQGKTKPLLFRQWVPGMVLEAGPFGIPIPPPSCPVITPEILLVPCLAFDSQGYRLGYGGGYYDRTLESLRGGGHGAKVLAVGLAYGAQQCDEVPHDDRDQRLDWIVTEEGIQGPFGERQ